MALSRINSSMIGAGDVSNTEHAYLNSVTSNVQTQIDGVGGGKILQVKISNALSSQAGNSTQTLVDTGMTVDITPASASNKIFISASFTARHTLSSANYAAGVLATLLRGSTELCSQNVLRDEPTGTNIHTFYWPMNFSFLDSPSTTSSTTYKIQFAKAGSYTYSTWVPAAGQSFAYNHARIVVMEVEG